MAYELKSETRTRRYKIFFDRMDIFLFQQLYLLNDSDNAGFTVILNLKVKR